MNNNKINETTFDFSDDDDDLNEQDEQQVVITPVTKTLDWINLGVPESQAEDQEQEKEDEAMTMVPETFGIVLVNIQKAAEERTIHCENRRLGDRQTRYVALSYRWGELDEQMVMATKDYNARIISFQLDDFFKLCQAMLHEPDLKDIEYVWVDAICVDQENREKRKATIYRMNEIYIHAAAIVAVPDLHAFHLSTSTTANHDAMATIQHYRPYLYHLLVGTPEALHTLRKMDDAWMNKQEQQNHPSGNLFFRLFHKKAYAQLVYYQQLERQQHLAQRQADIIQSMNFLQSLMEDWSNRTWVISEYHIAKRKTGTLKFWYNQLSSAELNGQRFFEFDFKKQAQHPSTTNNSNKTLYWTSEKFKASMRHQLTKRTVLEMMLQTKASKADDRFHAIIPLAPKYKHHIKDRHSIAAWGISDMLSVRLKLMEWMDTKDRLNLLYSAQTPQPITVPFLPTFATCLKTIKPGLLKLMSYADDAQRNFDIDNSNCVRLIRPAPQGDGDEEENGGLDILWLCPRHYYTQASPPSTCFYQQIGAKKHKLWKDIGLDPGTDRLDAVSIPLFLMDDDGMSNEENSDVDPFSVTGLLTSDLQLVGSWEKNRWVAYRFCSNYKHGKIYPSQMGHMNQQSTGFRIY